MADANPWGADSWNVSNQNSYLQKNGMARAQARARDAGTWFGGPHPRTLQRDAQSAASISALNSNAKVAIAPRVATFSRAAIVRPGSNAIYELEDPTRPFNSEADNITRT